MRFITGLAFVLLVTGQAFAQKSLLPALVQKNGHYSLIVDGKPFFVLGGQVHNSSAWPKMMPAVWRSAAILKLNTLEIPIYWEQMEPQSGKFDFSFVNTLLQQSRQHRVKLVLLWFGTWKNGSNHYMPEWMKRDAARYPNITDKNGQPVDSPSPHANATLQADIKAFKALMSYLAQTDQQHQVIMVQVENESGSWGSVRDYSPEAQKLFAGPVPGKLLEPGLLRALNVPLVTAGTWMEVFGDRADEYFQAWYTASFIGQVAAAGKSVYPLPLYTNAALRDPLTNPTANNYESGGPTDNVIPIWKATAPALDLVAPDIYLSGSERILKVLDLYNRPENALFVPELGLSEERAKYLFEVIARGGIGFSPFGIDDNGTVETAAQTAKRLAPFAMEYATLEPLINMLARQATEGKISSVVEHDDHADQTINLGSWQLILKFGGDGRANAAPLYTPEATGKLLVVKLGDNKFMLIGSRCHVTFKPNGNNAGWAWQYLKVEEGAYSHGDFKATRILNGDETDWGGPGFSDKPTILQVSLVVR